MREIKKTTTNKMIRVNSYISQENKKFVSAYAKKHDLTEGSVLRVALNRLEKQQPIK